MAFNSYTLADETVARTYWTYALDGESALRGGVPLAATSAGTSSDMADLGLAVATTPVVRILATSGWLPLSFGYYSTSQHPAGSTITIPQATHGLRAVRGLMVTVHNSSTGAQEVADVTVTTGGLVTVTFVSSAAANSKQITIIGPVA